MVATGCSGAAPLLLLLLLLNAYLFAIHTHTHTLALALKPTRYAVITIWNEGHSAANTHARCRFDVHTHTDNKFNVKTTVPRRRRCVVCVQHCAALCGQSGTEYKTFLFKGGIQKNENVERIKRCLRIGREPCALRRVVLTVHRLHRMCHGCHSVGPFKRYAAGRWRADSVHHTEAVAFQLLRWLTKCLFCGGRQKTEEMQESVNGTLSIL